jgi:hypothetical protein
MSGALCKPNFGTDANHFSNAILASKQIKADPMNN